MKTLGLIGGIGPESTIAYYRLLVAGYRDAAGGSYPPVIINSVDLKQAHFYPDVFSRAGISLVTPIHVEQTYIHDKYMNELLNDIFPPKTKSELLNIADKLKARHNIEALILGGTELPLILNDEDHNGIRMLDTTRIHVNRLLREMLPAV